MRRMVLYIAMSLDGYLADPAGGVDWLAGQDPAWDGNGGYASFVQTVDTVIMGRRTYDQITTQLSPGIWPYEGLSTWVLTHRSAPEAEGEIHFTAQSLDRLAAQLQALPGRDIWLCGGADLVRQALEQDLIDELRLTIIPTLLGAGIPLFNGLSGPKLLKLISLRSENGMVECIYHRREDVQ
ncbi:MAG: dihydrofolate reductase [Oscillospiraceae bacterium]|jgi:dihydrofolate reductase|nr:dihydrofolate reductase [Oscillospiraceae bacterium]